MRKVRLHARFLLAVAAVKCTSSACTTGGSFGGGPTGAMCTYGGLEILTSDDHDASLHHHHHQLRESRN
jgi:hypothetical protein